MPAVDGWGGCRADPHQASGSAHQSGQLLQTNVVNLIDVERRCGL